MTLLLVLSNLPDGRSSAEPSAIKRLGRKYRRLRLKKYSVLRESAIPACPHPLCNPRRNHGGPLGKTEEKVDYTR